MEDLEVLNKEPKYFDIKDGYIIENKNKLSFYESVQWLRSYNLNIEVIKEVYKYINKEDIHLVVNFADSILHILVGVTYLSNEFGPLEIPLWPGEIVELDIDIQFDIINKLLNKRVLWYSKPNFLIEIFKIFTKNIEDDKLMHTLDMIEECGYAETNYKSDKLSELRLVLIDIIKNNLSSSENKLKIELLYGGV